MEVRCPRCQATLYLENAPTGAPVRCGICNALFTCPESVPTPTENAPGVIDVHAEPVAGTYEPPDEPEPVNEHDNAYASESRRTTQEHPGNYVVIERHLSMRDTSDFGCCGCGCLLMLLLFLIFMTGCASIALV